MVLQINLYRSFLIPLGIFIAVFAGFQGGRYVLANRFQELGIACALALFLLAAWRGLQTMEYREWRRWVLSPVLLIGGIMTVSALVFALQYQGSLLFSVFSAREFMLAFIGPGIYLLCRSGFPTDRVLTVLWWAMLALMVNYLFFYNTMDLRQAFFSDDHTVSNLVTYDPWRGFRLKPPMFAIMLALLASVLSLVNGGGPYGRSFSVLLAGLAVYIWSIVLFRSTLASMLLAALLYPIFLARVSQLRIILVLAPLILLALPISISQVVQHFLGADGGEIRAKAFLLAFEYVLEHPILGAGEDSAYGMSYQDIVAPYFYPSDIGLMGVAFKYGLVGLCLYLTMHIKIWIALWWANITLKAHLGRLEPLLWSMLIFMTAQTFNLVLNPGLAYAQGITAGSLAYGLACLARRQPETFGESMNLSRQEPAQVAG